MQELNSSCVGNFRRAKVLWNRLEEHYGSLPALTILMESEHDRAGDLPRRLARLIEAADGAEGEWQPEELGDVLVHQLNSPVEFELSEFITPESDPIWADGLNSIHSFSQLFSSSAPPLELLRLTKDYAKAHLGHPETTLAKEIASALYYASIALALTRHRVRITQLTNPQLASGFQHCLNQPWMESGLRRLFGCALAELAAPKLYP